MLLSRAGARGRHATVRNMDQAEKLPDEREVVVMAKDKDKDIKKKERKGIKGKKEKSQTDASCCYVMDPCGCYVNPCCC